ncbi:hypothetical protein [Aureispira anguillae]|uniref:Uncharacterized protein n=1 Tax=Aureispira anguillae TaxID=2864201 RepID=A0A916DXE4_9BACT|nr:hypothetical protein [Aureispira anguillae]BDS14996.1 hypothetical protein AsAng_0057780 [Aureispira anguillae]
MSRKNNKKKSFSDNLEFLFQERMLDDNAQDNLTMIENDKKDKKTAKTKTKGGATAAKKSTAKKRKPASKTNRKSFSNNLERFFKDSIDGVLDGVVTDVKRSMVGKGKRKAIGIDLLIKRTTEDNLKQKSTKADSQTKRVTVVLDTAKLEELKRIAKEEKRRLHQIIGELVAEYIDEVKR